MALVQRFKRLQDLLASGKSTANAVLVILGADSRFNGGSNRLLEWLCEGKNPLQLPTAPSSPENLEDDTEDVLILLDQSCVHLYCNPICLALLIPFVAKLRNLHLHCLEPEQFPGQDISDVLEEFKIKTFINITRPHKAIGIPYFPGHSPSQKDFDPMVLEKEFPLIQAHAAEEFGGNGFFTLSHSVVEMTPCLEDLYSELDLPALMEIISKVLPGFMAQWENGLFPLLDSARSTDTIASLKEDRLAEAFQLYVKHWQGQERSFKSSKGGASGVWLGCNTAHMTGDQQQQQMVTVGSSGPGHEACLHMVCRLCAGPLLATRTYFLQNSRQTDHTSINQDMRLLQMVYSCVVAAAHLGIHTFTSTQSQAEAYKSVELSIKEQCVKKGVPLPQDFWDSNDLQRVTRSNLVIQVEAFDLFGRLLSLGEKEWIPSLKQLSVCVHNIPCCSNPDLSLGSVAFAETFVDSVILMENGWDSQHVVLTTQIPNTLSWPASKADIVHQKEIKEKVQQSGELGLDHVTDAAPVYVVVSGQQTPQPFTARLWILKEGFVIEDKHFGLALLPLEEIKTLLFHSGNSPGSLALIMLECMPMLNHCLPPELVDNQGTGTESCIVLAFSPQYQTAWRTLYQQILPFLHSLGEQQFKPTDDVPKHIENMYKELQEHLLSQPGPQPSHSVAVPTQPLQLHSRMQRFSQHFEMACSLKYDKDPLDSATLQQIVSLEASGSTIKPNDGKLIVTVVTGIPGSHQDALCTTLLELGREDLRWTLLRQPFDVTSAFDRENLHQSLSTIVANLKRKGPTQRRLLAGVRRSRILLVTPWFTDVLEVLQTIATHPDQSIQDSVVVGCVTACVDQNNVYMHDRAFFPKLLENCSEGLVNNIIFTGSESHPNHASASKEVEHLMRCCNSHASFITAPGAVITSSSDLDLILAEDAWTSGEILRQRTLRYQGWQRGAIPIEPPNPAFDLICLKFRVPLNRSKLESKLRDLKPVVHSDSVDQSYAEALLYHIKGKVALEGLSNPVELYFTRQSGYMRISGLKDVYGQSPSGPYESCVVFAGVGLQENALKLWLEDCRGETTKPLPFKTKHSLTDKELAQIKAKCSDSPLPDGYFYTGQYYVSFDGQKTLQHPLLEDYIQEYIEECNNEVMLYNQHLSNDAMFS